MDYKEAGVDVFAGYAAVSMMKEYVKKTYDKFVIGDVGSFGGFYALGEGDNPDVLVAGTDGVGTKLKYAFALDTHDTIGIDAVAMCVNDIICSGAKPLIFLDYIAIPKLIPEKVASIVKGVSLGCIEGGCALIGGETAEMPGLYTEGEYDIAGFACGIVKKSNIITGASIEKGDVLIGLKSSGIHSNGYSLVRKIFPPQKEELEKYNERLGESLANVLLRPTKIYVKSVLAILEKFNLEGISHITGGGFIENIPRVLPKGLGALIYKGAYEIPEIFLMIQELAKLSSEKMYNTFNMGVGMILVAKKEVQDGIILLAKKLGEDAFLLGEVVEGSGVTFEDI